MNLIASPADADTVLKEGQWQIEDLRMGTGTIFPLASFPDISYGSIEDQDKKRPRGNGVNMGRDRRASNVFTFEGAVWSENLQRDLQWLSKWWRGHPAQRIPGKYVSLKYCFEGEQRQVFGRPRDFAPMPGPPGGRAGREWINFMCTFKCIDDMFYSQERFSHTVPITQSSLGGLMAPLVAPLTTTGFGTSTSGEFSSGGNTEAWLKAVINGPIFMPAFELIDSTDSWNQLMPTVSLNYDQKAIINSEPWDRKIVDESGYSLAGGFDQQSRKLSEFWLPPGDHEVVFRGIDPTGTATVEFSWFEAFLNL